VVAVEDWQPFMQHQLQKPRTQTGGTSCAR